MRPGPKRPTNGGENKRCCTEIAGFRGRPPVSWCGIGTETRRANNSAANSRMTRKHEPNKGALTIGQRDREK